jgi:hypothetical protein
MLDIMLVKNDMNRPRHPVTGNKQALEKDGVIVVSCQLLVQRFLSSR